MFHLWLFSFVDGLILPFELFKIILYFWPLCGFIFSRLKEPKYLVHTEENCKLSKFDLELVGNCRSTNCRAGTTQKQNSMIYLIVVIHRHTQYIKAVFFPFFSFSWNNFPKKEFRRIAVARKGMGCKCCFVVFMCALRKKRVVIMVLFFFSWILVENGAKKSPLFRLFLFAVCSTK